MAGGIGSRFWPASRVDMPKQFLDILGMGKTLLQMSYERALQLAPKENILIATNLQYDELVQRQLGVNENNILLEPSRNNTAPCIAYSALKIQKRNPDALFGVMPSDHVVQDEEQFTSTLNRAFEFAEEKRAIVTLGINPSRPDTGYGYIKFRKNDSSSVFEVESFKEKPDKETAEAYLESGSYLWNAGIFVWHIDTILSAFLEHAPQIHSILSYGMDQYDTEGEQSFINEQYPKTQNISIDYAVLEKAKNVYTIPSSFGWTDLGTWNSLYEYLDKDENGNVIVDSKTSLEGSEKNLIKSDKNKLIVVDGLQDYIIIDTEDALLIYPKSKEQEIKQLRENIDPKHL